MSRLLAPVGKCFSAMRMRARREQPAGSRLAFESLESRVLLAFNPSHAEQAMMEDINRMRIDPESELDVLFRVTRPLLSDDANIQSAINFFNVDADVLLNQWKRLEPAPPLAWSEELADAAFSHNLR